ncbi:MAG: hypothetical protein QCH35_08460 [Methanomicrobiaceae archaeon]|nr:hypothetical protein [Methanomicrobiaceae archaeon]
MKNKLFKFVFVAVLSLALVIASAGIAAAAKPVRTIEISVTQVNPFMGILSPSASFDFDNYGAWGYKYQWYKKGPSYDDTFLPYGAMQYVWFDRRQTSGTDIDLPLPEGPEWSLHDTSKVNVWLLKTNGDYVRGFEPPEPGPSIGWVTPAGGPGSKVIQLIPNSPSPGLYQPTCAFNYNLYKAWGYKYLWSKSTGAGPSVYYPIGDWQYVWFDGKQTSGTNLAATGPDGQTFGYLEGYRVEVWLINNGGKEIADTYITAGIKSF